MVVLAVDLVRELAREVQFEEFRPAKGEDAALEQESIIGRPERDGSELTEYAPGEQGIRCIATETGGSQATFELGLCFCGGEDRNLLW